MLQLHLVFLGGKKLGHPGEGGRREGERRVGGREGGGRRRRRDGERGKEEEIEREVGER